MLVHEFLTLTAARLPEKVALVCGQERLTYRQLDQMSDRLAHALVRQGVERGDRVALYLPNGVEAVVGIFATLKAGATFVYLNTATRPDKLAFILNHCRASALLAEGRSWARDLPGLWRAVPSLRSGIVCGPSAAPEDPLLHRFATIQAECPAIPLPVITIDLDLACLVYTSGSTGEPKGVMCDHGNVVFASGSILSYLESREDDIVLCALPLSFDYGLYQLLMTFRIGATLVLEPGFTFPALILQRIQEERVTGFPGVPTLFAILLRMDLGGFDLGSLRTLTNTAAALFPGQIRALQQAFPSARLFSMYGLTETKRTLYLPPAQLAIRPDSVGIAIPGTEVWLEDETGRRLGPGETGELVVRGRHVMRGYWEAPEASAARFPPGPIPGERVCHSGDLFRMDAEGYCTFVARKDDIIKCRGEKVAPTEVERVLELLPGVSAAVLGIQDALEGQAVKAVVVCHGAAVSTAAILAHCRIHLEEYMVPKVIEFRDALPMTSSGKVNKTGLR